MYDDDWDDGAEEHFFTPSIVFLELENGYQPNTWSQDTYRLEKKLLRIAVNGLLRPIDATTSRQTSTT